MTFAEMLPKLLTGSRVFCATQPEVFYEVDEAEGGKFGVWKMDHAEDELRPNRGFGLTQLAATDWEVAVG